MKRGIFFTLTAITLFSLLLLLAGNYLLSRSQSGQIVDAGVLRKIAFEWDSADDNLFQTLNLSVAQSGNQISIGDNLPAPHSISNSLQAYASFIQYYYQPPELNFTFRNPAGVVIPLSSLNPPLQILPSGFNYSYPDFGKNELDVVVPEANFSQLQGINENLTLPGSWFNQNLADMQQNPCNYWSPLKKCSHGTADCFSFNLTITDINGSKYTNTGCNSLDADKNSNLQLNLYYPGGSNAWIKVLVGTLPELLTVQLQNANVSSNTTFVLNSAQEYLNLPFYMRVSSPSFNYSKTAVIG